MRSRRSSLALAALIVACAALAPAICAPAAQAASYKWCNLTPREQQPPGGTPAYNLELSRQNTSCRTAKQVMQDFHACRTAVGYRCARKVVKRWRCTGAKDAGEPTFHGTLRCRSGAARVIGTYQQDTPRCFGAAARDPLLPCVNNARALTMPPDDGWICDPTAQPPACLFGYLGSDARGSFAIFGDSHVHHWRSALSVVAPIEKWRGYSLAVGGCFFSEEVARFLDTCEPWLRTQLTWLDTHPEVGTVFLTGNADTYIALGPGEDQLTVKVDGVKRALAKLPSTVKHVIVLRDTTISTQPTLDCLNRALTDGRQRLAIACPLARSVALRTDALVEAVRELKSPRYQTIDLSSYMCGERGCYPVVGGTKVNNDLYGHLETAFTRSLGPYLLRELRTLMATW